MKSCTYRPETMTMIMVENASPPFDMPLWITTLLYHKTSAHVEKREKNVDPSPRPLISPAFFPYSYVFNSAFLYDSTAFSSPTNAWTVRTFPITCINKIS